MPSGTDIIRRNKQPDDDGIVPQLLEQIQELQRENKFLRHQLDDLRHRLFGRKSEKLDPNQLQMFLAEQVARITAAPADETDHAAEDVVPLRRRRRKKRPNHPGRAPLPAHLPRERVEIDLDPAQKQCPCCQKPLKKIGEEITEELGRVPAKVFVRQLVRLKYACPRCQEHVQRPELPPRPIEKAKAGPDVLADILVSKYADHLPLYRQQQMYQRDGVDLSRTTMCQWVGRCSFLLQPIVQQLKKELLQSGVVQSDDTPVQYQDPDARGPTKKGFLWAYVSLDQDVVYDFTTGRSARGPTEFLRGFAGVLQADAYAGYNEILAEDAITHAACWAHVRRKFVEARRSAPLESAQALDLIQQLYRVEAEAKELGLRYQERAALRNRRSRPLIEKLAALLQELLPQALPKSPLGQAIAYALGQWPALGLYLADGRVEIDNNSCERAMRRVAVGRKNWLFAGSPNGGEWAAGIYSLIETCCRHRINPRVYLTDVLPLVVTHPQSRIEELTPRGWLRTRGPDQPNAVIQRQGS